ncbi:MAG TPA: hypothetical protein VNV88_06150 [Candidatus Solibacter sp.]|nr:hypothetical protein [Candidatus Solibacter sp.]
MIRLSTEVIPGAAHAASFKRDPTFGDGDVDFAVAVGMNTLVSFGIFARTGDINFVRAYFQ